MCIFPTLEHKIELLKNMATTIQYSVQEESLKLLENGILKNPLIKGLPAEIHSFKDLVSFEGKQTPSIPVVWRFAESISSLKAFEALMLNVLLVRKYKIPPPQIKINTDHASLFVMSPLNASLVEEDGTRIGGPEAVVKLFPNTDHHRSQFSLHRQLVTNIYKTKDDRYYHTHGSCYQLTASRGDAEQEGDSKIRSDVVFHDPLLMVTVLTGSLNPEPTMTALGIQPEGVDGETYDDIVSRYQAAVERFTATELDTLMNDQYRKAGTVAWTPEEYFASEHGKANAHIDLYTIDKEETQNQGPSWWPEVPETSTQRPLAGLKVIDLTRIIAGPCITRSLAEMGARVMRVTAEHIDDMSALHHDLNWGKWNCYLDLRSAGDREKLRKLISEADVVVDGYRPGVMGKWGFGREDIYALCKDRERGVIHVRENCYGWNGPWQGRSGWQQISDACCGVSYEYGKAMGVAGAVTPVFPNSDYCCGVSGSAAVLQALCKRGEKGGSYGIDVSLNYYSQWLVRSCGKYPAEVWSELWKSTGSLTFQHYHVMINMIRQVGKAMYEYNAATLLQPSFFEIRKSGALGQFIRTIKPVAQFPNGEVTLGFGIGTRGNGVDEAVWPEDMNVEIVV
ncbi:hypothetical protein N7466_006807 [Penicillium verhagenii]|uniref:uncharacterized protein n=1 Tax=Penicillium verhagenii TaxID=1562060 RepID=UPI0025456139|nr:uncharacterized protein N7466_006807 [Penicillium verhagenii]KAJ5927851.1 hypothetical protein N7466_006807 [Penicillium verhagenii]